MDYVLQILQTMLVVSLVVGVVWLFGKLLGKNTGYRWRKMLWLMLALRLLWPISFPLGDMEESFQGWTIEVEIPEQVIMPMKAGTAEAVVMTENEVFRDNGTVNDIMYYDVASTDITPVDTNALSNRNEISGNAASGYPISWGNGIFLGWGVVAMSLLCLRILQYRNIKKKCLGESVVCADESLLKMRDSLCKELGISKMLPIRMLNHSSALCNSPMLLGYFHPMLLIPEGMYDASELDAIMRHELTHYSGRDLWYKLLQMLVCDLYWFNPIIRLMKRMAFQDVELVCDEKAIAKLDLAAKREYSNVILKTMSEAQGRNLAFASSFAGNKKSAKERLENIFSSHNRKLGVGIFVLFLVVVLVGTIGVSVKILKEEETYAGTEDAQVAETIEPTMEGGTKVEAIRIDSGLLNTENAEALLAEFAETYPKLEISAVDVTFNYREDEFYEQSPSLFQIGKMHMEQLIQAGRIADVTEILKELGWLEQMDEAMKATVSDAKGRIYGIPLPGSYTYGLMVNVQLFREAGLVDEEDAPQIPATWEELAQTAVRIKETTGNAGFCLLAKDYAGSQQFCNLAWNFGATELVTVKQDGRYQAHLDSEAAIAAMEFVKALKWEYGVLTEEPLQEDFSTGFEHLANGTAAMYLGANDAVSIPIAYGMKAEDIALGAVPAGQGGSQYSLHNGSMAVFPADATQEEIRVGLSLLERMGVAPESGGSISGEYEDRLRVEVENVNPDRFQTYYEAIQKPGNLKGEDAVMTSVLYEEVLGVLQKVMKDPEADVEQLMKQANENWQKALDTEFE